MNSVVRLASKDEIWDRVTEAIDSVRDGLGRDVLDCDDEEVIYIRAKAAVLEEVRGRLRAQLYTGDTSGE